MLNGSSRQRGTKGLSQPQLLDIFFVRLRIINNQYRQAVVFLLFLRRNTINQGQKLSQ